VIENNNKLLFVIQSPLFVIIIFFLFPIIMKSTRNTFDLQSPLILSLIKVQNRSNLLLENTLKNYAFQWLQNLITETTTYIFVKPINPKLKQQRIKQPLNLNFGKIPVN